MTDRRGRPTMLYDGTCGFCTRVVEVALARLPDAVTWEPYQSVELPAYGVSEAEAARSVQLVERSGRIEHGSAAVARVLVLSGGGWALLGRMLLVPPVSLVAEAVYRLVGALRGRLPGVTPALARLPEDRPGAATSARGRSPVTAVVTAVSASPRHGFAKPNQPVVRLLAGLGVEGDAHLGRTVQHRSRVRRDPSAANLRQVHLVHAELHDELAAAGFAVGAGEMGENVTTRALDLLGLPTGTRLRLGPDAEVEVTGLRNPCVQLDRFQPGLMAATLDRDADGGLVRKAGVMAVVVTGGDVRPGDDITVALPPEPHQPLRPV